MQKIKQSLRLATGPSGKDEGYDGFIDSKMAFFTD